MKSYGQFCPVAKAAEVFCERWTALILRDLALGATRFSELQRGVPLMSPSLLSRRLRQLAAEGIVERRGAAAGRGGTWHLTPAGEEFVPIVVALGTWGQRWSRRDLQPHELDLGLLVWVLERGADGSAFAGERTLVELSFTDQPVHKRTWWFLVDDGRTELCVHPPGFDVDVWLAATLADVTRLWRGDLGWDEARATGRLDVHGSAKRCRQARAWFPVSLLAGVASARSAYPYGSSGGPTNSRP